MNCLGPLCPSSEQFKPDDHSELVPLLPIPNRTVKRLSADDSADARVKVGHRQANYSEQSPRRKTGAFVSLRVEMMGKGGRDLSAKFGWVLNAAAGSCCQVLADKESAANKKSSQDA